MLFDIEVYSDGIRRKFGNSYCLTLEETIEELQSNPIFDNYLEEDLNEFLKNLKDYIIKGTRWSEIKITKK